MLKLALAGVWVAAMTGGAAYVTATVDFGGDSVAAGAVEEDAGAEDISTEMTSVPLVRGGVIVGYVIIQLSFQADRLLLEKLKIEPKPYLVDAAFRTIYGAREVDFTRLRPGDMDLLTDGITRAANDRIGGKLVRQVLIQQLNYVRKEDIRTHWIKEN